MLKRFLKLLKPNFILDSVFLFVITWQVFLFFRLRGLCWTEGLVENYFMSKGLMIYKDFVDTYPPIFKLFLWPLHAVFNYDLRITVYLSLIVTLTTIAMLYVLAKKYLRPWAGIASLLFFALWNSYILPLNLLEPEAVIGLLLLISCFLFLHWHKKKQVKTIFVLGLSLALLFSVKQITLPAIIVFIVFVFFFGKQQIKWLFAGLILPYVPIFVWFTLKGALRDAFFWNVMHYLGGYYPYTKRGREARDVVNFVILSLPILVASIWLIRDRLKKHKINRKLAIVTLPTLSMLPAIWFAVFFPNRFLSILPLSSLLFGWTAQELTNKIQSLKEHFFISILLLLLFVPQLWRISTEVIPSHVENIKEGRNVEIYNQHLPGQPEYEIAQWFKENTPAETKILVFGDAMLYLDAQRFPANNRVFALPWLYRPLPEFKKLLQEKPPEYWLVDETLFERFKQWDDSEMADFIKRHLDENYPKEVAREDYWVIRQKV